MDRRTFLARLGAVAPVAGMGLHAVRTSVFASPPRSNLRLFVQRIEQAGTCTRGVLLTQVDGEASPTHTCYVLEPRSVPDAPGITTIPAGTYTVTVRTDGSRGWRLELQNVPNWTNVQIHLGNYPQDTRGCLLPGTSVKPGECSVLGSAAAIQQVRTLFAAFGSVGQTEITIRD
jgi:hypothetical protein